VGKLNTQYIIKLAPNKVSITAMQQTFSIIQRQLRYWQDICTKVGIVFFNAFNLSFLERSKYSKYPFSHPNKSPLADQ